MTGAEMRESGESVPVTPERVESPPLPGGHAGAIV